MNTYTMTASDLNTMLSLINYYHNKIREGSIILGENFDRISEELISELSEFVDLELDMDGHASRVEVECDQSQSEWQKHAA